ncbi:MAG: hypothetical protein A3G32_04405 [Deltaproteobacteria bacterium RIFCSPLOWO2_12_FULL_40_28]|nr:MAG: hypothetical protein A3C45_08515 [Deltaproteobacteria bacterium RIFCSPHIGHO2_02_FULL_40_28]OGQ19613.1 MAG: hypothetical protein A3E27_07710 [Deltaproteobacteria bacterium RIFCSPHIGHO2_12_FULL_40_32]OGQ40890.1 MAG: hypothetical protein A3I69_03125 [Deltaproteobacteria bacterium RIFCSPLOWO2_02_FULL_40_36]OGQ54005.1 MAG: hypothetical protein A3G32_04405 [Deltaproteobacteria bacterium RIFCSPLOWO2_12_FULL_40_28]
MQPKVSIIIPCRNEVHFIVPCLDSILANDYQAHLVEILVIDGQSQDGTLEILERYQKTHGIKILNNPKKIIPFALNMGIAHASGDILIRMDAHTTYDSGYISNCVRALNSHPEVKIVGGVWITQSVKNTLISHVIQRALSHPFGVGNAYYRVGLKSKRFTDVVSYFCCRKNLFDEVGYFNELIERSEDIDFNRRVLKKFGSKSILVLPEIKCFYSVPDTFLALIRKFYLNGYWAIFPMQKVGYLAVSLRHLIPLYFFTFIILLSISALISPFIFKFFLALCFVYLFIDLIISLTIDHKSFLFCVNLVFIFPLMHLAYGLGSFIAVMRLLVPQNFKKIYFLRKKIKKAGHEIP